MEGMEVSSTHAQIVDLIDPNIVVQLVKKLTLSLSSTKPYDGSWRE
jgi:hypothetical protein